MLEYVLEQVGDKPKYCVIWLHGLGADGHDFVPVIPELQLPTTPGIRFIFPHAPVQPVTINGGYEMRAWYDITAADLTAHQDRQGIERSAQWIEEIIVEQNRNGIGTENIIRAGFSQGGAIALHVGLRSGHRFAGVMALSSYIPLTDELPLPAAPQPGCEYFLAHGKFDPIVPFAAGVRSKRLLVDNGYPVEWHEYPMEHSVCMEQIGDISGWIQKLTRAD
jgi:phospholipase/carboxylesterase